MSMQALAQMAAQMRKHNALKPSLPKEWRDTGRTKDGKRIYRVYAVCVKQVNAVVKAALALPLEAIDHILGDECPHCKGSGRYSAHRGHFANEKCYRCDGKGTLNGRDLAYFNRRKLGAGPICHIETA